MSLSLHREYLPATEKPYQELVLLHGWGSNREIWRSMLVALRPWANITLMDIPGLAPGLGIAGRTLTLDAVLEAILESSPARAVYVGWSLGGQLAVELAQLAPARVSAVVTLCSNPCFVASGDWPGMDPDTLGQFSAAAVDNPAAMLRRFDSLQAAGARHPRPLLRELQSMRRGESGGALGLGLNWLAVLDQRGYCADLPQPQCHLLGERDKLLPLELAASLRALFGDGQPASVEMMTGCSHLAPLEEGRAIATRLRDFLQQQGLLQAAEADAESLAKVDVARSFSLAAREYDSVAQLQRDVGRALLSRLDSLSEEPATILDLGSGTGYFREALCRRYPQADYLGLDLAEGMVRFARENHPGAGYWLVGDAESLPLAPDSVDLIYSSLALQWCHRPELLFAELARVLRPGGRCVFTSLGPDTLRELRASWAAVDQHQHVNEFLPLEVLAEAAASSPETCLQVEIQPYRMTYNRVRELLHELKTLGAHNVNRARPSGLTGRRVLQGMMQAYEEWREDGLLPATYEVYFGLLEKT